MSAIAEVLAMMGHDVSGCDRQATPVLDRLAHAGVTVSVGHDAAHIEGADGVADAVAVSSAIAAESDEIAAARAAGVPVLSRAEVLAAICGQRRTIAVAGTHGKTTTSAMVATILAENDLHPSFIVGGELLGLGTGARWDDGEWLVVEADESDGTFLQLPVEVAVVTSVEPDHLEHWGDFESLVAGFRQFVLAAPTRVVGVDDEAARGLAEAEAEADATLSYGFRDGADEQIVDYEGDRHGSSFGVVHRSGGRTEVALPLPGRHNAANAVGAIAAARCAGVSYEDATAALAHFRGVARRFHRRGEKDGVTYVDEYAHLPGEVSASLRAALDGGWRRVVCVFQPHRYSRTAALWAGFAHAFDALAPADVLAVTEIYPAGEPPRPGVTGKLIVDAVLDGGLQRRVAWLPTRPAVVTYLRRELRPGDLCLTLGAGDLTTLPDELLGEAS
jgi:UDP-N-acetylmuramate--alanine ligase